VFDRKEMAFYQCDHLGTPQELTDHEGSIAWSAQYKAWGEAREAISEAGRRAGFGNPIRFQGQYFDEETGLHYNRYRYYDPVSGRFVTRDPIRLIGGLNLHQYAPNPVEWMDPVGLARKRTAEPSVPSEPKKCTATRSSKDARREAMRRAGIATSSTPFAQRTPPKTASGFEQYLYKTTGEGGREKTMVVSHHKPDRDHACAHWHAAEAKTLEANGLPSVFSNGAWKYQANGPVVEHK